MTADLSICIPTRNRAGYLGKCLAHLRAFRRLRLEVVICDNASTDATRELVEAVPPGAFERLVYHRHAADIGVARNMDAALRMARAAYVWILADDDIPYESGLVYLVKYLEENPRAACIAGTYKSVRAMQPGADAFREPESVLVIPRGNFQRFAENILVTDAHPLMRRALFQRHCRVEERGFALGPLYAQLLLEGDIAHVPAVVFEHLMTPDSLSTKLSEASALDNVLGDVEVTFGMAPRAIDAATFASAKTLVQTNVYIYAARLARQQGDALLMRHFLLRCKAIRAVDAECLVQWEAAFLHRAAAQRLAQMLGDLGAATVWLDDGAVAAGLGERLAARCPGILFQPASGAPGPGAGDRTVRLGWDPAGAAAPADDCVAALSYSDILQTCRVTRYPITLRLDETGKCGLAHGDEAVAAMLLRRSRIFDYLMSDYGDDTGRDP